MMLLICRELQLVPSAAICCSSWCTVSRSHSMFDVQVGGVRWKGLSEGSYLKYNFSPTLIS